MMKNLLKRVLMLSLAMVMVLSMSTTALAVDTTITFVDANDPATGADRLGISFKPGSVYTTTDLFDNFKGLMPGDTETQEVEIINQAKNADYVRVYMYVKPHDAEKNVPQVEGKDGYVSLEAMQEFLSKLRMTITCAGTTIYDDSPNNVGNLADPTYLGTVDADQKIKLTVSLKVPIELDNTYANRIGEMDWVFYAEGYYYESVTVEKHWDDGGNKYHKRPKSVEVQLYRGDEKYGEPVELNKDNDWKYTWDKLQSDEKGKFTVKELKVPNDYHVSYKTENENDFSYTLKVINSMKLIQTGQLNWPIPVLGSLGVLMLCVGIFLLKRKEQENA